MPTQQEDFSERDDNLSEALSVIHDVIFRYIKNRRNEIEYYQNIQISISILSCLVSTYFIPQSSFTLCLLGCLLSSFATGLPYFLFVMRLDPPVCTFLLRPLLSLEKTTKKKVVYLMLDVFLKCQDGLMQVQIEDRLDVFVESTKIIWYLKEVQRFRTQ